MEKRDFLEDIDIVGVMLVSRYEAILDCTIPHLLRWCDWVLIVLDNENQEVTNKVFAFKEKYDKRIIVIRSSAPPLSPKEEEEPRSGKARWSVWKGNIRDDVFVFFKRWLMFDESRNIDMVIWPDHDEIFNEYFPELLKEFWNCDKYRAIAMKPVEVFRSMSTIKICDMSPHIRVFKYDSSLSALPYRHRAFYQPLTPKQLMRSNYVLTHLAYLNDYWIKWRAKHWKAPSLDNHIEESGMIKKLDKEVIYYHPKEIHEIIKEMIRNVNKNNKSC